MHKITHATVRDMTRLRRTEDLIVNFRDVGTTLAQLSGESLVPEGILYRGGRLKDVKSHEELLHIPTILNLRPQKNPKRFPATYLRAPAHDSSDIYDTSQKATRIWLNKAMSLLLKPDVHFPVYVHCTSGKDRTGVFIAALLKICMIEDSWIQQEYLWSDGDVDVRKISQTLDGIHDLKAYFRKVELSALRKKLLQVAI